MDDAEFSMALRSASQSRREHYAFLTREKEDAERTLARRTRALEEFVSRTKDEYRKTLSGIESVPDPSTITELEQAWQYTQRFVLGDVTRRTLIATLIRDQKNMEAAFVRTFERFSQQKEKQDILDKFFLDCHCRLEQFASEAHTQLKSLGVPLLVATDNYAQLSDDAKTLIGRIQDWRPDAGCE